MKKCSIILALLLCIVGVFAQENAGTSDQKARKSKYQCMDILISKENSKDYDFGVTCDILKHAYIGFSYSTNPSMGPCFYTGYQNRFFPLDAFMHSIHVGPYFRLLDRPEHSLSTDYGISFDYKLGIRINHKIAITLDYGLTYPHKHISDLLPDKHYYYFLPHLHKFHKYDSFGLGITCGLGL